jgi:hypothetical protein
MIEIRNEDNFAAWRAHCECGWSSHLLFGMEARDLAASRHIAAEHSSETILVTTVANLTSVGPEHGRASRHSAGG